MNQMSAISLPAKFGKTIATLVGDPRGTYSQMEMNARELSAHPFGLSLNGLDIRASYPKRRLHLLAHFDEPNKSILALTCVVRFVLDLEMHEGHAPYLRTFEAGAYRFFEIGCHHGIYICGHQTKIDECRSQLQAMNDKFDFLSWIWEVAIEAVELTDPATASETCSELKLLFC